MNESDTDGQEYPWNENGARVGGSKPYFYRDAKDPSLYRYVPGTPGVQRQSDGTPQLNVVVTNNMAMLQLSVEWSIDPDVLDSFRMFVAEKEDAPPVTAIRFAPAPYVVNEVALLIADVNGHMQSVTMTHPSGFGNNAAVFNLQLDPQHKERAIAALQGEPDLMQVVYNVSLPRTHQATTRIHGNVTQDVTGAEPNEGMEAMRQRIMTALDGGRLNLERTCTAGAVDELQPTADDAALTAAAEALCHMVQQRSRLALDPGATSEEDTTEDWTIDVKKTIEDQTVATMALVSDAADWLPDGDMGGHLQVF